MAGTAAAGVDTERELPRKERRRLEVRGRILEAAAELFAAQSYKATKVVDICERADVAKKTFFNHFPTKQHVIRELAQLVIDEIVVDIDTARNAAESTRERLRYFFDHVAQTIAEAGPMSREFSSELVHVVQESGEEGRQEQRLHHAFGAIVREGLKVGDVTRGHNPDLLAEAIIGVYYQLILNWVHHDDYPIQERAAEAARFLADALSP